MTSLDQSPASVLSALRGEIVDAHVAYPSVLHVEVRDARGGLWRFATQYASWSPTDVETLIGRSLDSLTLELSDARLTWRLSGGSTLCVAPVEGETGKDDPPTWELIAPDGLLLEFGPGVRWRIEPPAPAGRRP